MLTGWLWIHSPGQIDIEESTLSAPTGVLCWSPPSTYPGPPAQKKEKSHWRPQRTAQERFRRSTMHPLACSSIDRRRRRFLLIHSSLSGIIQSTTELFWNLRLLFVRVEPVHRAWKPKEGPLGWRRKPQETSDIGPAPGVEWRRKASVDRNDCVWCVCVMTRCQVAQGNQNKMAKLPHGQQCKVTYRKPGQDLPGSNPVVSHFFTLIILYREAQNYSSCFLFSKTDGVWKPLQVILH